MQRKSENSTESAKKIFFLKVQGKSLENIRDFPCTFKKNIFLNTQNHPSRNLKIIFGGPAGLFVTLKNVYQVFSIRGTGYRRFQMIRACPDFVSKEMYRRGARAQVMQRKTPTSKSLMNFQDKLDLSRMNFSLDLSLMIFLGQIGMVLLNDRWRFRTA